MLPLTELESRPKFPYRELIAAGPDAARVLVRHTIEVNGLRVQNAAQRQRSLVDFDVEAHVNNLIKSQVALARSEGAGAAAVATAAEMSSVVSGPAAITAVATTILVDLAALARIQVRLSLMIAAAYGHDMSDVDTRTQEILSLHNLEVTAVKAASPAAGRAGQRVGRRLLERYLRGPLLQALKSMFRLVGIKFSRAALVRGLPLVNIPVNATIADMSTRRTASKARNYYRTLPTG